MKNFLHGLVFLLFLVLPAIGLPQAAPQTNAPLPSLEVLRSMFDTPEASSNFIAFKAKYGLKLYSHKETVELKTTSDKANHYRVTTLTKYGGNGFILSIDSIIPTTNGVRDATSGKYQTRLPDVPRVRRINLIVGDCEEARKLGKWKGELPAIGELPKNAKTLLAQHVEADADIQEVRTVGRFEESRRRYISFGGTIPENANFPYEFIFDNDKLSLLVLYPQKDSKLIPDE